MPTRRAAVAWLWALGWLPSLLGCGPPPTAVTPLATLSGVVTETPPTQTTVVVGALVRVVAGAVQGAAVTSDSQGRYALPSLSGDVNLEVSREGYATRTVQVTVPSDGSSVNLQIGPTPGIVTNTTGTGTLFSTKSVIVPVHNAGEVTITDVSFYGFEEGDGLTFEVLEDGQLVAGTFLERSFPRHTVALRAFVTGGRMVEVRASGYWTFLTFTHPR